MICRFVSLLFVTAALGCRVSCPENTIESGGRCEPLTTPDANVPQPDGSTPDSSNTDSGLQCSAGTLECDSDPATACETPSGTLTNCTRCGETCGFACGVRGCNDLIAVDGYLGHTCFVRTEGDVFCVGSDEHGRLGNGSASGGTILSRVEGVANARAVAVGAHHGCALLSDTTVACWGRNHLGQLGIGNNEDKISAVPVPGVTGATRIAAGENHTCVIAQDVVRCWGSGEFGENGSMMMRTSPGDVSGTRGAKEISSGPRHNCVVLTSGSVRCWGENAFGQLGDGTTTTSAITVPVTRLGGNGKATLVAVGRTHTCAVLESANVQCWGRNQAGQLGVNNTTNSSTPLLVSGISAREIAAGEEHTCVIADDRAVACWGGNAFGQVGDATMTSRSTPTSVESEIRAVQLGAGQHYLCAVYENGSARCWGRNHTGQLGDGTFEMRLEPADVLAP